jgi:hypothetical protein
VDLPPLPFPAAQLDRLCATATAVAQIGAALGINLLQPGAGARLAGSLASLRLSWPRLMPQLAPLSANLAATVQLATALSVIGQARTLLGLDLLAPGAALQLQLALAVPAVAMPPAAGLPPVLQARVAAYARLGQAASLLGGVNRLLPALEVLARLQLPALSLPAAALGTLSLLLSLRQNLGAVLGLAPQAGDFALRLQARLQPLWALAALKLPAPGLSAPPLPAWPGAGFEATLSTLAALPLAAVAQLKWPELGAPGLMAGVALSGQLAAPECCGRH